MAVSYPITAYKGVKTLIVIIFKLNKYTKEGYLTAETTIHTPLFPIVFNLIVNSFYFVTIYSVQLLFLITRSSK